MKLPLHELSSALITIELVTPVKLDTVAVKSVLNTGVTASAELLFTFVTLVTLPDVTL